MKVRRLRCRDRCPSGPALVKRRAAFPASRRLLFEPLENRLLLAVVQWDGGSSGIGTSWHDPENWVDDALPKADDDVEIGLDFADITVSSGDDVTVNSLASHAALEIVDGTFSIATTSTINNALILTAGTLNVAEDLTVSGQLTWTGGTMQGTGQTLAEGGLGISGADSKSLDGYSLINSGTGSITTTTVDGTGTLTNAAGQTLMVTSSTINADLVNEGFLDVRGSSNSINSSFTNVAGATLRVLGDASRYGTGDAYLTVANGFSNYGLIRLTSTGTWWGNPPRKHVYMTVNSGRNRSHPG